MTRSRRRQLGRMLLRETLRLRRERRLDPESFPLAGEYVQRTLARLGVRVGEHTAYRIVRELLDSGEVERAGSYRQRYDPRQPSGWRVPLYRLGLLSTLGRARRSPVASIRRRRRGKATERREDRRRWWAHSLFGTPDGRPPPGMSRSQRRRSRSADELLPPWAAEAWA